MALHAVYGCRAILPGEPHFVDQEHTGRVISCRSIAACSPSSLVMFTGERRPATLGRMMVVTWGNAGFSRRFDFVFVGT
ncbi:MULTISPECIES: hypothetical protein [Nocardia]|uniref:hypothetical protein n=1 Tax=Nocardia TaxID=1817 RepID=UPI0012E7E3DF|nr:hypothetical protein [Nocardia sp. Root136]